MCRAILFFPGKKERKYIWKKEVEIFEITIIFHENEHLKVCAVVSKFL